MCALLMMPNQYSSFLFRCVRLNPEWGKAHARLGAALMSFNRTKQALQAYERALECDSTNQLVKAALRQARSEALSRGQSPPPPPEINLASVKAKGNAAFGKKNYDEAGGQYTLALDGEVPSDDERAKLYSNRSAAMLGIGAHGQAVADTRRCVQLAPKWPKAYSRLGAALIATGDVQVWHFQHEIVLLINTSIDRLLWMHLQKDWRSTRKARPYKVG